MKVHDQQIYLHANVVYTCFRYWNTLYEILHFELVQIVCSIVRHDTKLHAEHFNIGQPKRTKHLSTDCILSCTTVIYRRVERNSKQQNSRVAQLTKIRITSLSKGHFALKWVSFLPHPQKDIIVAFFPITVIKKFHVNNNYRRPKVMGNQKKAVCIRSL